MAEGGTRVVGVEIGGLCCFMLEASAVDDDQTYKYVRSCESSSSSTGGT